jgi:GH24 family phage-related lysozyme (muramidase)
MRDSVAQAFRSFSVKFEGYLKFMYQDVKNLVTTGMGNLIDPIGQALSLPWVNADGSPCSQQEISDAWHAVKARTDLAQRGGGHYESVTSIRLTDEGIDKVIQSRLKSNEAVLRQRYPDYENWPADAQLGILSMSWAMGPAFKFPKFMGHVNASPPDFTTAADDSHMSTEGNGGSLVHRNEANRQLFLNAAAVIANGADPSALYYPNPVPAGGGAPAQPPATPADPPARPAAGTGGAASSGGTTPPASDPGATPATPRPPADPSSPSGHATGGGGTGGAAPASGGGTSPGSGTGGSGDGSGDGPGAGSGGDAPMAGFGVEAYVTIDPDDGTTQHQQTVQAPKSAKLILNWVSNLAASVSISDVGDGLAETGAHPLETKDATYVVTAVSHEGILSVPVVITVTTHPDDEVVSPHTELSSGFGAVVAFHAMLKGAVVTHATVGDEVTLSMIVSESADAATINGAEVALVPTEDGHKSGSVKVTLDGSKNDFFCEALREGEVDDSGVLHLDLAPAPAPAPDPAPTPSGPDDPPAPQPTNNDDPPAPAPDPAPPAPTPEPAPPEPEPAPPAPAPDPAPPAVDPVPPAPAPAPVPPADPNAVKSRDEYPNTPEDLRQRYLHMKFKAGDVDVEFSLEQLKYHNESIKKPHPDYILPNAELKDLLIGIKKKLKKDKGPEFYAELLGRFAEDNKMIAPYPFMGKGSPAQIEAVLKIIACTNGAGLGHFWVDKGDINASLADFYWNHMGLDCSGFAGNYARWIGGPEDDRIYSGVPKYGELNPELPISEFARIGKKRRALEEIMMGDLICWANGSHISTILSHDGGTLHCVESNGDSKVKGLGTMDRKVVFAGGDLWTLGGSESVRIVSFS